jgi:pilus assembly protein CpaB
MQFRTGLVGLLALIFSVSAGLAAYLFKQQSPGGAEVETVSIVVAAAPIPRGVTLSKEMLRTRQWPKEYVPQGAVLTIEEAVGRSVWIPLIENDTLVESKLGTIGAGRGLASLIPRGMRAITIQTPNVATGVAGFILPGNKVDVLWTVSQVAQKDETGGGSTATLLQNVEILAVDQQIEMPHENKVDLRELRSVTLLVTPSDASKLDLAQNRGTLRLSLRNPEDSMTDPIEMATLLEMRGVGALPLELDFNDPESLAAANSRSLTAAVAPEVAPEVERVPDLVLPIRTLRGTSSGSVYLRTPPRRTPAVLDHQSKVADRS